jgi:hypothetical protein
VRRACHSVCRGVRAVWSRSGSAALAGPAIGYPASLASAPIGLASTRWSQRPLIPPARSIEIGADQPVVVAMRESCLVPWLGRVGHALASTTAGVATRQWIP